MTLSANARPIATVTALHHFPVKSMRAASPVLSADLRSQVGGLTAAHVYWHGLDGDRRYAFVQSENPSGFPWLTGRQQPHLLRYTPYFVDPANVQRSAVRVRTPDGRDLAIDDDALCNELAEAFGAPVHLLKLNRGAFDSMPISLISRQTVAAVAEAAGRPLDPLRFRANILLETANGRYPERGWLNGRLTFGQRPDSAQVRVNRTIGRCKMIDIDPDTAERDGRVLAAVAAGWDNCAGVYASAERPGSIHLGDTVFLEER